MASQQTPNYNLNQWEKTDRIMMDDFNADNEKLDAALLSKLGKAQIIKTIPVNSAERQLDIDLRDVDWSKWDTVGIFYNAYNHFSDDTDTAVAVGGSPTSATSWGVSGESYFFMGKPSPTIILLFPLHDKTREVWGLFFAGSCGAGCSNFPFSELASIRLTRENQYFPTGRSITVWGIG